MKFFHNSDIYYLENFKIIKYYTNFKVFLSFYNYCSLFQKISYFIFLLGNFRKCKIFFKLKKTKKKYYEGELNINFNFKKVSINILI